MTLLRAILVVALTSLPMTVSAETFLLMGEEKGCVWCARWNRELADIYPKTPEGAAAPLRRFDIHGDPPEGITLASRVRFTPTFILVRDGVEVDRIEGYAGDLFFWGLLGMMLDRAQVDYGETG